MGSVDWARSGFWISMLGKLSWFCLTGLITMVLLMWKWMGLFLRKNHLLRCWGWPSVLNWKKIGGLIRSIKFLSGVAPYLYKSIIYAHLWNSCHVWAGAPSCYLELLDQLLKRVCRTVSRCFAVSFEPLPHRRIVASLSLFYRYYFGRCSSELAQLVPLLFSRGRFTRYSDGLHDFSVTIPRC